MYVTVEKLKLVIRQFDENGEEIKDGDLLCDFEIKGGQLGNSLQFRISAVLSSGWQIPVHWDGNVEYSFQE